MRHSGTKGATLQRQEKPHGVLSCGAVPFEVTYTLLNPKRRETNGSHMAARDVKFHTIGSLVMWQLMMQIYRGSTHDIAVWSVDQGRQTHHAMSDSKARSEKQQSREFNDNVRQVHPVQHDGTHGYEARQQSA